MLRRHSEIFRTVLLLGDVLLVAASWLGAYALRFHSGLPAPLGVPPLEPYLVALGLLLPVWGWVFRSRGLYAPRRIDSTLSEIGSVFAGGHDRRGVAGGRAPSSRAPTSSRAA